MSEQQLRQALADLRSELDRLEAEEGQVRERLDGLAAALETHAGEPRDPERHDSLLVELRQSILELEASHPKTTGILHRITAALGNVG